MISLSVSNAAKEPKPINQSIETLTEKVNQPNDPGVESVVQDDEAFWLKSKGLNET